MLLKLKLDEFGFFTVKELKTLNNQGIYTVEDFIKADCIKSKIDKNLYIREPLKLEKFNSKVLRMLRDFKIEY